MNDIGPTIRIDKIGGRYIARCTFEQRVISKGAGFRWDPAGKMWYTNDPTIAARISDPASAAKLAADAKAKEAAKTASIEASRSASADIDLPCPEGLAYLPYQRAGIAFGLDRESVLFGDEMGLGKPFRRSV